MVQGQLLIYLGYALEYPGFRGNVFKNYFFYYYYYLIKFVLHIQKYYASKYLLENQGADKDTPHIFTVTPQKRQNVDIVGFNCWTATN